MMSMSKIRSSPIIKLFRPYFKLEFIILSLMSINAVFNLANPILLRVVIDKVLILRQINLLKEILIILIAIYILRNVSSYLIGYFNTYIGEKYSFELHHEIIKRIQKAKLTEVNSLTAGDFINKSINDVNIITGFLSGTVVSILNISFDLLAMLGLMLFFSVKLSLISIVVTIIYIYISIRFGKLIKRNQENIRVKSSEYISLLGRIFSSIRSIKAYNKETHYLRKHCSLFRKIINLDFEAFFYSFGYNSLLSFVGFLGAIITLVVGISDVFRGALTIGTLFVFDTLSERFNLSANNLVGINTGFQSFLVSFSRVDSLLKLVSEDCSSEIAPSEDSTISIQQLSFQYQNTNQAAIQRFSFKFKQGEIYAIVGESGGGKSTLINLLLRLYDFPDNTIFIGSTDINRLNLKKVREKFSPLFQNAVLIEDTIIDNLRLHNKSASKEDVQRIAKLCLIDEFIEQLPRKYETVIGEQGIELSGGQKQRILLVQSLLKDAQIYIFDESLSSLDKKMELAVFTNIQNMLKGKTQIFITHNVELIRGIENIIVLSNGTVEAFGDFDYLSENSKTFREFIIGAQRNNEKI